MVAGSRELIGGGTEGGGAKARGDWRDRRGKRPPRESRPGIRWRGRRSPAVWASAHGYSDVYRSSARLWGSALWHRSRVQNVHASICSACAMLVVVGARVERWSGELPCGLVFTNVVACSLMRRREHI